MYKVFLLGLLAVVPSSTNFILNAYDFGNGSDSQSSSNYQLQGSAGTEGGTLASANYGLPAGIKASETVATPVAPTFSNPSNEYNRLKLTLNVSGMPSDVKYLIAISDDNFTTTKYVQTDQTIGTPSGVSNYQTYATWGGASGFWILGLTNNTTYKVKVAALQGSATGSPFGPTATAATVEPNVTFAVSTSLTSSPPFTITFTSLPAGQVTSGDATINVDITTNAIHGGALLIGSQNSGLNSSLASYSIASATADLSGVNDGYGAQVTGTSQSGGGPIGAVSPFNGSANNVGALTTSWQQLATFVNPITGGNLTLALKAKASSAVPASTDYSDTVTVSASLLF